MTTDLQKTRNKQYFIDAAKSVVITDGVTNVTVRKVAEIAGFSYATIYNEVFKLSTQNTRMIMTNMVASDIVNINISGLS